MDADVIVIGGGAAGLMCAATAAQRGRRVIVLEHNDRVGKKILISGGGRCNFTNLHTTHENYLSGNPDFCRSALARFTPLHTLALVEKHGISYHEKKLGQLFCDDSSRQITSMLTRECKEAGVEIFLQTRVEDLEKNDAFRVLTSRGILEAPSVVIASGGLSFPKLGTSDLALRIARKFHITLVEPRPALVPLTLRQEDLDLYVDLSGVAVDSIISLGKRQFRENVLFTHRGLSGPAILQISSYWKEGDSLSINLCPELDMERWLSEQRAEKTLFENVLSRKLPRRLAEILCRQFNVTHPINQVSNKSLHDISHQIHHWDIRPDGTEGYEKAEVTCGGVETGELSSKTMESKKVKGLYFVGEAIDVTGHLGGFNFQWAWASGHACGECV